MTNEANTERKERRRVTPQTLYRNVEAAMLRLDITGDQSVEEFLNALKDEWFAEM